MIFNKATYRLTQVAARSVLAVIAALPMGACSGGSDEPCDSSRAEILPLVQTADTVEVDVSSRGISLSDGVSHPAVFAYTTAAPTSGNGAYIFNETCVSYSGSGTTRCFNPKRYFPASDALYFFAYWPPQANGNITKNDKRSGSTVEEPSVYFELNGAMDIQYANDVRGIKLAESGTQTQPNLVFSHKLRICDVYFKRSSDFPSGYKVKEFQFRNAWYKYKFYLKDGTWVRISGDGKTFISEEKYHNLDITTTDQMGAEFIIGPDESTARINVVITDPNGNETTYQIPDITFNSTYAEGTYEQIFITFTGKEIRLLYNLKTWGASYDYYENYYPGGSNAW